MRPESQAARRETTSNNSMASEQDTAINCNTSGASPMDLTQQQKEFAAAFLNEIEGERAQKIQQIRDWIDQSEDLCVRPDDFFILRFLRGCKFDVDRAKQKLRRYHEQRSLLPEWFANRDPFLPEMQQLLDLGVFLPLRNVDEEGRLVVVIRACLHDPKKHPLADVLKVGLMLLDLAAREHVHCSLYGIVAIHDLRGAQLSHALQMRPGVVKKLVSTYHSYPNRVRSLDFVHAPGHVNVVLNVFRQFMSGKLKQRMHVHAKDAILRKISPSVLPTELGGTDSDYETLARYWKEQAQQNKQWFVDDEKYKLKT